MTPDMIGAYIIIAMGVGFVIGWIGRDIEGGR